MNGRKEFDYYPTPQSIIEVLLNNIRWDVNEIWEPCAGDGRLVSAMQSRGYKVVAEDIQSGQDFFESKVTACPSLITNPPFRRIREFIDHAFDIGVQRMALVTPERLWACGKGGEQWSRFRPTCFANLTWREDYLNKGKSPDRALAISIWDEPHSKATSYEIWQRVK